MFIVGVFLKLYFTCAGFSALAVRLPDGAGEQSWLSLAELKDVFLVIDCRPE